MKAKHFDKTRIALVGVILFVAASAIFFTTKSFSSGNSPDIEYFKGSWTVKIKDNPKLVFSWTVKENLNGSWLGGIVERNGIEVTNDFWRQSGKKIERYAFTSDGTFVRVESDGWESKRLVFNGMMSGKAGETKVRETITKISDKEFQALWEKENADGKWSVFSDEMCTK